MYRGEDRRGTALVFAGAWTAGRPSRLPSGKARLRAVLERALPPEGWAATQPVPRWRSVPGPGLGEGLRVTARVTLWPVAIWRQGSLQICRISISAPRRKPAVMFAISVVFRKGWRPGPGPAQVRYGAPAVALSCRGGLTLRHLGQPLRATGGRVPVPVKSRSGEPASRRDAGQGPPPLAMTSRRARAVSSVRRPRAASRGLPRCGRRPERPPAPEEPKQKK
jgi:hypothetical protein